MCEFCSPTGGYCCVCMDHHDGKRNDRRATEQANTGRTPDDGTVHVPIQALREIVTRTLSETCGHQS